MIDFSQLSATEFEELCYDLLVKLGFNNVSWRKGTGKNSSPADGGRDIEACFFKSDVDNKKYYEKWNIECKHYKEGVPAEKIRSAITWASAQRVDVLLIIASNFLSNSCKEYIEHEKINCNFRIKVWENKDLEEMLNSHIDLLHKYNINATMSTIEIMNPYHISYISSIPYNTLNYFYNILEEIDEEKREKLLSSTYYFFARTVFKQPINENDKILDTITNPYSYENFKKVCEINLINSTEMYIVNGIVNMTLQILFHQGNRNNINYFIEQRNKLIESMKTISKNDEKFNTESVKHFIKKIEQENTIIPDRVNTDYELYNYFCNNVVEKLLKEKFLYL